MSKTRIYNIISLALNTTIVVATIICSILLINNPNLAGGIFFRYYTNLSNIFVAITSLILLPYNVMNIIYNKERFPLWARLLKFVATCAMMLTFLTVMLFLGPTQGYGKMLGGALIFFHLLTPLFALISFALCESKQGFNWKFAFLGASTSLVYGVVYCINVLGTQAWPDFYGFTKFLPAWAMFIIMQLGMLIVSFGVYFLQVLFRKRIR